LPETGEYPVFIFGKRGLWGTKGGQKRQHLKVRKGTKVSSRKFWEVLPLLGQGLEGFLKDTGLAWKA